MAIGNLHSEADLRAFIQQELDRSTIGVLVRQGQGGVVPGTGTPESALTAPVGTIYRRLDGGAGTSFYVKESGTGNTGWVAK